MAGTPVDDWATDYDIFDPGYVADPYPIWDDLRDDVPDRAHRSLGRLVAADALRRRVGDRPRRRALQLPARRRAAAGRPADEELLPAGLPPIHADPPVHTWTRRLLLPWFSHRRVDAVRGVHPRAVRRA